MKRFHCMETPLKIYGLAEGYGPGRYWKLHESMFGKVSETVTELGQRSTGGRVRFRTDSSQITVRVTLKTLTDDQNFSILGAAGCDILLGLKKDSFYAGIVSPLHYSDGLINECTITRAPVMEDVAIYMPRNSLLQDIEIFVDDNAVVEAPTPYLYNAPIIYYGSSITEGCTANRPSGSYTALLSRWLHADFINLGFSGAAKGEMVMADFIGRLKTPLFVMDYDYNAPNAEHLAATHEPFFKRFRTLQPNTPVLFLSAPDTDYNSNEKSKRRDIVYATYKNARASGDTRVAFIDGHDLFGNDDRSICTIDTCHPSEIGMMRMAQTIYPVAQELLSR